VRTWKPRLWLVLLLGNLSAFSAQAGSSGQTPAPPTDFSGFRLGLTGGAGFGDSGGTQTHIDDTLDDPVPPIFPSSFDAIGVGYLLGPEAGYRWQFDRFVLGADADITFGNATQSGTTFGVSTAGAPLSTSESSTLHWLSTWRASIGYVPADDFLAYVTGGLGAGSFTNTASMLYGSTQYTGSRSVLQAGWVLGAGAELAVSGPWHVAIEYLHADLGDATTIAFRATPFQFRTQSAIALQENVIRAGVSYSFGSGDRTSDRTQGTPWPGLSLLQAINSEIGLRYWYSLGTMGYTLYDATGATKVSQLNYHGFASNAMELFGRAEHPIGAFVKFNIGIGTETGGELEDQDFPPVTTPYSKEIDPLGNGGLQYATVDFGFDVLNKPTMHLGPFLGYGYLGEQFNAYGCTQAATNMQHCVPSFSPDILSISENAGWNFARLGLAGDVRLWDRVTLSADVAWLPFGGLHGTDTHWARLNNPAQSSPLSAPIAQSGSVSGVQLDVMLHYQVSRSCNVAIGGRFWQVNSRGTSLLSAQQVTSFSTERYGPFAGIAIAF
jgi:opacity protein-like surface antigen